MQRDVCSLVIMYLLTSIWYIFLGDLYCLSRISLNSLVFTIRRQVVPRKPKRTLLQTQGIFNLPHHIYMVWEQMAFDDAVRYTQQWKSKLAEVMAWGLEPLTFKLGVRLQNKVRPPNHSATEDATIYTQIFGIYLSYIDLYIYPFVLGGGDSSVV